MKVHTNTSAFSENRAAFAAWADIYDTQSNPLLALEERYLSCVLPSINDRDILDAGCGTGRWLRRLEDVGSPRSLHGIDSSPEMVTTARQTCGRSTSLTLAHLPHLPILSQSIDLALCSFTLSYVTDMKSLAGQFRRVLRDGGDLLITDMHPDTANKLGWQRSFRYIGTSIHLHSNAHSIDAISNVFAMQGFKIVGLYQPSFGEPEYSIFSDCGKHASYEEATGRPAIYILHLRLNSQPVSRSRITLSNMNFVLGSQELETGILTIEDDRVASTISIHPKQRAHNDLDMAGYTLFPGLINAHDHLEFSLFPRLGFPPYRNATEWAHDIHNRFQPIIEKHTSVPRDIRLWWGAIRNLLCGTTSICHHNPMSPVFYDPQFPVHVLTELDWAHSLAFSTNVDEFRSPSSPIKPFILHACEGVDSAAKSEFTQLVDKGLIDERTVLVHGLAMDLDEIGTLNQRGASLISCPSSNCFLFSKTPSIDELLAVERLAIGSDSPLTSDGDLMDEIRFCSNHLKLPSNRLFDFVTRVPATILRLKNDAGRIAPGAAADLFAVRSCSLPPAQQLVSLSWRDVELVIVGGTIRLASCEMMQRLPPKVKGGLFPLSIEGVIRWIAAPVSSLFVSAARILGENGVSFSGRPISIPDISHV